MIRMPEARFKHAIERIDAANSEDPNHETLDDGTRISKEIVYAQRMTRRLERLEPDASEVLRLAVRAQHIRRWTILRDSFPTGRKGYHQWRTTLYRFHADEAGRIMEDAGYDEPSVQRVQSLLRKERLKQDAEAQTLEDVACLVFLESYFAEFARKHDDEKLRTIIRKTWRKMSERGQQAALKLELDSGSRERIERALE